MVNLFLQGIFWAWNNSAEIAQLGQRQIEIFWKLFLEYLAHTLYAEFFFSLNVKKFSKHFVEDTGIDAATSRMLSARSTIWANPPTPEKFTVKCNTTSYELVPKFSYHFLLVFAFSLKSAISAWTLNTNQPK